MANEEEKRRQALIRLRAELGDVNFVAFVMAAREWKPLQARMIVSADQTGKRNEFMKREGYVSELGEFTEEFYQLGRF